MSESTLEYLVYWWDSLDILHEEDFASLTEASIRKAELTRQGFVARIVGVKTTIDDRS